MQYTDSGRAGGGGDLHDPTKVNVISIIYEVSGGYVSMKYIQAM